MNFDFEFWRTKYLSEYRDTLEYFSQGTWVVEHSPLFSDISACVIDRGYLLHKEFINICRWKTVRPGYRYDDVRNAERIECVSNDIIERYKSHGSHGTTESIEQLISLEGVQVSVASAILTVLFPATYCIIDYRVIRLLYYLDNSIREGLCFPSYIEYARALDTLTRSPSKATFSSYIDRISEEAMQLNTSARELEMSLWKYSQSRGVRI